MKIRWKTPQQSPSEGSLCWIYVPKLKVYRGVTYAIFDEGYFKDFEGNVWSDGDIDRYCLIVPPDPPAEHD